MEDIQDDNKEDGYIDWVQHKCIPDDFKDGYQRESKHLDDRWGRIDCKRF
jgi:hypothetical protein